MPRALRLFTPACALVVMAAIWVVAHRAGASPSNQTMPKSSNVLMVAKVAVPTGREPDEHVLVLADRCRGRRADRRAATSAATRAAPVTAARLALRAPTRVAPAPAATPPATASVPASSSIQGIIRSAFLPLGPNAVTWALRVSRCESGYNPRAVNASSNAEGLFQFLPSTWASTPYAGSSPLDPVANARAAEWLYSRYGPGQWACK